MESNRPPRERREQVNKWMAKLVDKAIDKKATFLAFTYIKF